MSASEENGGGGVDGGSGSSTDAATAPMEVDEGQDVLAVSLDVDELLQSLVAGLDEGMLSETIAMAVPTSVTPATENESETNDSLPHASSVDPTTCSSSCEVVPKSEIESECSTHSSSSCVVNEDALKPEPIESKVPADSNDVLAAEVDNSSEVVQTADMPNVSQAPEPASAKSDSTTKQGN